MARADFYSDLFCRYELFFRYIFSMAMYRESIVKEDLPQTKFELSFQ